jgi:hypothetical protein
MEPDPRTNDLDHGSRALGAPTGQQPWITSWTRRRFLAGAGVAAAGLAGGLGAACSGSGGGSARKPIPRSTSSSTAPNKPDPAGIVVGDLPSEEQVFGWIKEVVSHGIRRPGYPADVWAEGWIQQQFREMGLENVHREAVPLRSWKPGTSSLRVTTATGETRDIKHFPVPYAAPVRDLDIELVAYDAAHQSAVAGKASLYTVKLITLPATALARSGTVPKDMTGRIIDDAEHSLAKGQHTVPFAPEFQDVAGPSIKASAAAFIGTLTASPGDTYEYYVPYTSDELPIPGVWISASSGNWVHDQLAKGPVRIRLNVESTVTDHTSYNIVGDLPGADEEVVIVASHHDGPWASAVEDGSGTSLVLAQVHYWSRRPRAERPHRLRFILQAGHMCGGAGMVAYVKAHREELGNVALEVHLEHAALEAEEDSDGKLVTTDRAVPRWFFTSRHATLEKAVSNALTGERLTRSMVMAPDAFGSVPPTDGQGYFAAGVPAVNFLTAPWYLFDSVDTLDKIDRAHLVPLTRVTIRIIQFTAETTAAKLRAEPPTP